MGGRVHTCVGNTPGGYTACRGRWERSGWLLYLHTRWERIGNIHGGYPTFTALGTLRAATPPIHTLGTCRAAAPLAHALGMHREHPWRIPRFYSVGNAQGGHTAYT